MTFLKKSTETKIARLINRIVSVLFFAVCIAYGSDKNIGQSLDDFAEGVMQTFASVRLRSFGATAVRSTNLAKMIIAGAHLLTDKVREPNMRLCKSYGIVC